MNNEVKCWCRHCGTELPPSHTGPCPKCGKSGKDCKVSAIVAIGLAVSYSAQKVHKYTKKHPWFFSISIVLTIISPILGYLLVGLVGLLIGIILAILNWWLTPHAREAIVEITRLGDGGRKTQEAEVKNSTQQKDYSHKDIYRKLKDIENKIESSTQIQKFGIIYVLGAAFIILGLSYWLALLQRTGMDTPRFYLINVSGLLALGTFALVYAFTFRRRAEGKEREAKWEKVSKMKILLWISLAVVIIIVIQTLFWPDKIDLAWVILGLAVAVGLQVVYLLRKK